MNKERGLTLIEVLIALTVLAIALTALVQSTTVNIRDTNYLRDKNVAVWVAADGMSQVQLDLVNLSGNAKSAEMKTRMLGQDWFWKATSSTTPDPYTNKIIISVSKQPGGKPLIVFPGFKQVFPN